VTNTVEVTAPPARALMVYDGDCCFCKRWIRRWQAVAGNQLDFLPYQDASVRERFPHVPREQFETAVQLIEVNGRIYGGAEAVFRALAHNPRRAWLHRWYARSRWFARITEWGYRAVARHRSFFSALTRLAGR
jgi:lipase maturation factor 1